MEPINVLKRDLAVHLSQNASLSVVASIVAYNTHVPLFVLVRDHILRLLSEELESR